jgi:hypothetical protein
VYLKFGWVLSALVCSDSQEQSGVDTFVADERNGPHTSHENSGSGGPGHLTSGNKTTCCIREVGTDLRERGTRAPGLALLWHCWHSARGVMCVAR